MLYIIEIGKRITSTPEIWRIEDKEEFIDIMRRVSEDLDYSVHDYDSAIYAMKHDISGYFVLDGDDEAREFLAERPLLWNNIAVCEKLKKLMA